MASLLEIANTRHKTCECRPDKCDNCGMRFPRRYMAWHRKQCAEIMACDLCHLLVPSSSKITHDKWICSSQNIWVLCELCHTFVSYRSKEHHCASCAGENDVSHIRARANPSAGKPVCQIRQSQNTPDFVFSQDEEDAIYTKMSETQGFDLQKGAFTPNPRAEHPRLDRSDNQHYSIKYLHSWSQSKRNKWRDLMVSIDSNQLDLRWAMGNCKY